MRLIVSLGIILSCYSLVEAAPKNSIACPIVADRKDGTATNSSSRYYCFKSFSDAAKAKFPKATSAWAWTGGEATEYYQTGNFNLKRRNFRLVYAHLGNEAFKVTVYSAVNGSANGYQAVDIVGQVGGATPIELLTGNIFYLVIEASGPWFVRVE